MTIKRKIVSAIATGALLVNAFTPLAFADTTIEISGNGEDSDNTTYVSANNSTTVVQSNISTVINTVYSDANTGKNDANRNTGGDVTVDTGDATSTVDLSTKANVNKADVNNCGGCDGDANVLISGNGADSDNKVGLKSTADTNVYQNNDAFVINTVYSDANTGKNDANRNTGGSVEILTGNAESDVDISTAVNANVATVGGSGNGSMVDARIVGNGEDSNNRIWLGLNSPVTIVQDNLATVINTVYTDADTGKNDANRNTGDVNGGDPEISTGDADSDIEVKNSVNANIFGSLENIHLPGGINFDFHFDLNGLLGSIHLG